MQFIILIWLFGDKISLLFDSLSETKNFYNEHRNGNRNRNACQLNTNDLEDQKR